MGLSFFGLTYETAPIIRNNLYTQIHEICFHGKGGYDWNTVYAMPRWLRLFTFNKINEFYQKENEEYEKAKSPNSNKSTLVSPDGTINKQGWDSVPKPITPGPKVKYK